MGEQPSALVLEMRNVCKAFAKPLPVLANINVAIREGEIVGLLGRSGSGKSTLLRIAGGLIKPTSGEVNYLNVQLTGPAKGIAVVFQTFALFPWLTVLENVEAGLDALSLPREEARKRALSAIDLIGLDGFQTAYPRELSGGMRQRVGFARAIVVGPTLLLMDEPFSALDVLTAETLRTDFLDLWIEHQLPVKAMLLVTHNIEEAVLMCDRILVLSSSPGRVAEQIPVGLSHPRNRLDVAFRNIVGEIYSALTSGATESIGLQGRDHGGLVRPLAPVSVGLIEGLIAAMASPEYEGRADLARIARQLHLDVDDLFPIAEALHILEFAELRDGAIKLTAAGRVFAQSGTEQRKQLFKEHLLRFVPLAAHIRHVLDERAGHRAPRVRFESELEDHLHRREAERTLRTVIGWGRYAELFAYDDKTRTFTSGALR
jgi:NitT/TauT family transport system ATP-binding protein